MNVASVWNFVHIYLSIEEHQEPQGQEDRNHFGNDRESEANYDVWKSKFGPEDELTSTLLPWLVGADFNSLMQPRMILYFQRCWQK